MADKKKISKKGDSRFPKGLLVAVGGNEDKENDLEILRSIKSLVKKDMVRIEVITTASEFPEETGKKYTKAFEKVGGSSIGLMHITRREQAYGVNLLKRIRNADIIYFTGGDQLRITSILGGTPLIEEVLRRYQEEQCIIAGTSAGASAMSETMIFGGDSSEALLKGTLNITGGIGLIDSVVIDTHFIKRGRFSRLMQLVCMNPGYVGIGLGEDTGIVIEDGHILKAIGNGLIVIIEGKDLRYTNVVDIGHGDAIAIENLSVHTIVMGHGYDLTEKRYLKPADMECSTLRCNQ